jgi:hypothetical protein
MWLKPALLGAAALAFAQAASAQPVSLAPVSFSPEFQTAVEEEYGAREGETLRTAVTDAITAALERRGASLVDAGGVNIEVAIIDADPNRPTMQQLIDRPGLDAIRSISIGGAELHAVLRGADGQVLSEVSHRRYNYSLDELNGAAAPGHPAVRKQGCRRLCRARQRAIVGSARAGSVPDPRCRPCPPWRTLPANAAQAACASAG